MDCSFTDSRPWGQVFRVVSWRLRPVKTKRGGHALRPLRKHAGADILELRVIFDVESKGGRASFYVW